MSWRLEYTPYIWPGIASTVLLALLAIYGWRRRSVPAALPFVVLIICGIVWDLGGALELASGDLAAKVLWAKFQSACQLPTVTAGVWFALDYGDLRRWLVRRNLVLSAIPALLWVLLALTNDEHHILWSGFWFKGSVHLVNNTGAWILLGYAFLLGLIMTLVFVWLFWNSPLHRVPVGLCLCGQVAARVAYGLKTAGITSVMHVDPLVLMFNFSAAMYAVALFRFRLFNLIPIARGTVIDQMREGMLVLDGEGRIMDLNPAAEKIVRVRAARVRGGHPADFLAGFSLGEESEVMLGAGNAVRHYALHHSMLNDRRGLPVGALILLEDVTGQKEAQARLLEQQRALATLHERARVARELHDSLGQVLAFVKMQAYTARGLVARGDAEQADACLAQLGAAAESAHEDVREYILGARKGASAGLAFKAALDDYLRRFTEMCGVATRLTLPPELAESSFEPMVETQLLRIIQEALANVRKHARASAVDIRAVVNAGHVEFVIQDDGAGFDPAAVESAAGRKFGLSVMRERAEEVGGAVQVHSAPGKGTRILISCPLAVPAGGGQC